MQLVIDKILTNYQEIGDEENVLLILHGWKRSLNEWIPIAKEFSKKYKVIILDLPGFGGSALPEKSYDTYEYADFVEKFLNKLEINNCTLIGHSFGGRLGIILASQTDLINKLILVDSAGIEEKSLYTQLKILFYKIFVKPFKKLIPSNLKEKVGSSDYKNAGILRETFVKVVNQDLTHLFNKIKVPTIVIWGEKDSVLDIRQTKVFKKLIPQSIVRIVWGSDHSPHTEKPKEFLDILGEYL